MHHLHLCVLLASQSEFQLRFFTGATQCPSVLCNGNSVILQGIDLGTVQVPFHQVKLS